MINFSGSNYLFLEQISMVPKMFVLMRFDCILTLFIGQGDTSFTLREKTGAVKTTAFLQIAAQLL